MNKNLKAAQNEKWVVLHLRSGETLIGFYNDRLQGWAQVYEDNPKLLTIRDIMGWEPFDGEPPIPPAKRQGGPRKPVQVLGREKALACIAARQAEQGRPKKPRKPIQVIGLRKRED